MTAGRPSKQALLQRQWLPITEACIKGIIGECSRAFGKGRDSAILVKMKADNITLDNIMRGAKMPCDQDGYVIKRYLCASLLDALYEKGFSKWCSSDIYAQRKGPMLMLARLENSLDNCLL